MAAPLLEAEAPAAVARAGGRGGFAEVPSHGGDDRGGGWTADPARFGLWAFLGTISMLFAGFTSAYIVRRAGADFRPIAAPDLLWWNSLVLVGSSVALELARRRLRAWELAGARRFVSATGLLGTAFAAGQLLVWRLLADRGIFLASNPHSSFFYVLTGLHALHLAGGLVWLAVLRVRLSRLAVTPGQDGLGLLAAYWHYLDALWIYLALLLFVF
jgi:cytochrome c oxidase subunit 3